jgi:hypothetical protein
MSGRRTSAAGFTMPPKRIAMLAVLESVLYGLVARHAYDEGLTLAVPLTFVFFLLLPMAEGCRSVASSEAAVGSLSPFASARMLLTGAVFGGVLGLVCVLALLPFALLMALLGGIPASLVQGVRCRQKAECAVHSPSSCSGRTS